MGIKARRLLPAESKTKEIYAINRNGRVVVRTRENSAGGGKKFSKPFSEYHAANSYDNEQSWERSKNLTIV
jgi:hypothetical protein